MPNCAEIICRAGEQVLVTCNPGFVLAGSPVITCVGDNSLSDQPICIGSGRGNPPVRPQPQPFTPNVNLRWETVTLIPPTVTILPDRQPGNLMPVEIFQNPADSLPQWPMPMTPAVGSGRTVTLMPERGRTVPNPVYPGAGQPINSGLQYPMATSAPPQDRGCYVGPYIPAMVAQNEQSYILDASVQVFPDLQFTCSGYIRRWSFYCLSRYYERAEIFLDVWRPVQQYGTSINDYQLIGSNLVRSMVYGFNQVDVGPGQQLEARAGDVIGFHYSNTTISNRFLVIPLADERDPWPFGTNDLGRVFTNSSLTHDQVMDLNGLVSFNLKVNPTNRLPQRRLPFIQAAVVSITGQASNDVIRRPAYGRSANSRAIDSARRTSNRRRMKKVRRNRSTTQEPYNEEQN